LTVCAPIAKLVRCMSEPPWPSSRSTQAEPTPPPAQGRAMVAFTVVFCFARHLAWQEIVPS
jgi:hypothetical protein